jgi:hypothetical protein
MIVTVKRFVANFVSIIMQKNVQHVFIYKFKMLLFILIQLDFRY